MAVFIPACATLIDDLSRYRYSTKMKVSEVIRLVTQDGWVLVRTRGSHRQYKHPQKKGLITISGRPSDEIDRGTLNSVLKQAILKE